MASIEDEAPPVSLTMFTFDQIVAEIVAKKAAALEKDSWERLRVVAEELALTAASDEFDVVTNHRWELVSVSVDGFRGVLNSTPLELFFETEPGVTVLHGPNGAGKSSISDAIELALSGKPGGRSRGTGGNLSLWDPVAVGRGSAAASVSVVLASGSSRLHLSCELDAAGDVAARGAEIEDAAGRRSIALGKLWAEALASYTPVFAYATLERRVQLSKDLQSYFESLLALGGCFTALKESIDESGAIAADSLSRWKAARDASQSALRSVDAQWTTGVDDLDPVSLPEVTVEIDDWVSESGVLESGAQEQAVPRDAATQMAEVSAGLRLAVKELAASTTSSHGGLAVSLQTLHSEALQLGLSEDRVCPVCGGDHVDWMTNLATTTAGLDKTRERQSAVITGLRSLAQLIEGVLTPILLIEEFQTVDDPFHADQLAGVAALGEFRHQTDAHGIAPHQVVISAALDVCDWVESDGAAQLVARAIEVTDRLKQWRIARALSVVDFLSVWRETRESAIESAAWQLALKRVEDLWKHLRTLRTAALEEKASERVQALLSDVCLTIHGLSVTQTTATLDLVDGSNNTLALGMLSAGQRNAVLLAPLLASVDAGPFGFVVLDDPVHAFDELRIDRLAETLAGLANARRVLVLTHDERLREHLVARPIKTTTKLVSRSVGAGTVSVEDSGHFWSQLLEDAMVILELTEQALGSAEAATDSVRALCRQSLDSGLREFVIINAITHRRDLERDIAMLDSASTTAARLSLAETLWVPVVGDVNPALTAQQVCSAHLADWNHAVHGDVATSVVTKAEIRAARAACKLLTRRRH